MSWGRVGSFLRRSVLRKAVDYIYYSSAGLSNVAVSLVQIFVLRSWGRFHPSDLTGRLNAGPGSWGKSHLAGVGR